MTDDNANLTHVLSDEEKQQSLLSVMELAEGLPSVIELTHQIETTGYHEVTAELWNTIRDGMPLMRMFIEVMLVSVQMTPELIENDELVNSMGEKFERAGLIPPPVEG